MVVRKTKIAAPKKATKATKAYRNPVPLHPVAGNDAKPANSKSRRNNKNHEAANTEISPRNGTNTPNKRTPGQRRICNAVREPGYELEMIGAILEEVVMPDGEMVNSGQFQLL